MNETPITSNSPDAESTETLLVEIRTEELPPKLLTGFGQEMNALVEVVKEDTKRVAEEAKRLVEEAKRLAEEAKRLAESNKSAELKKIVEKAEDISEKAEEHLKEVIEFEVPKKFVEKFANSLLEALQQAGFADEESACARNDDDEDKRFVTSRRLAAVLHGIHSESPAKQVSRRGPQMSNCRDADGAPTKALVGFMHSVGATCESDLTEITEKGKKYVAWEGLMAGRKLADDLAPIVQKVLLGLSAPRLMRWGDNDFRFVRPVHGVLMMHGKNVIRGTVMNVAAGETTKGHPVLSVGEISVTNADDYEKIMRDKGMVIVEEYARREEIVKQLREKEAEKQCSVSLSACPTQEGTSYLHCDDTLLHEVAGMCEYPTVYVGEIHGAESVPDFCIVGCMKKHQRFFPTYNKVPDVNEDGELNRTHYFVVADNKPEDPTLMLAGFNSVLRARLCDLSFYYTEDKKHSEDYYLERLKGVVYHGKLGSQHDRVRRLQTIACNVAELMELDDLQKALLKESARLCKADLSTHIIGEYPDMEGKIAAEYFCADEVAKIVRQHNPKTIEIGGMPRAYYALLLADNLEKLVGMFGINEKPTSSKDPHGLRSAAVNILLVLWREEKQLTGDKLLQMTAETFGELPHFDLHEIWNFIVARMPMSPSIMNADDVEKGAWQIQISRELQKTVRMRDNFSLADIYNRQQAVSRFAAFPQAETLIAASKRINNIFRKSAVESDSFSAPDVSLFEHDAERALHDSVIQLTADTNKQASKGDYVEALKTLTHVAQPVDEFFDKVMVNAEDEKIRHNRFALLHELRALLNCVVKLS